MKPSILNRKTHYWIAICISLPMLVITTTGLLLQFKKQAPWVQPAEHRGTGKAPTIGMDRILSACREIPELEVQSWSDISRVDIRPSRGMLKVLAENSWEAQIDSRTGEVLHVAYRRSDWLEALHDGSWFHAWVKFGLFIPAGVGLLVLLGTGLYLFWLPIVVRRRKSRTPGSAARQPARR